LTVSETTSGPVRGLSTGYGTAFLGVPYAAGPTGAARFAAPQPHEPWPGVRDATRPGPTAPQPVRGAFGTLDLSPYFGPGWQRGTDYLTVNIWTPPPSGEPAPVMVFVHGGGFVAGSINSPLYDGSTFARDGVVLVTVSYRLGIPGFLHLPGAPDNRGLLDVQAALRWVRDNIAGFGGDPGNVTLFGQSAGAILVGAALADPASAGLLRRVIIQSGSGLAAFTRTQAAVITADVGRELGVEPSVATLAGIDDDRFVELTPRLSGAALGTPLGAITPFSLVLDDQPATAVAAGAGSEVDMLIGDNLDEGALYLAPLGLLDDVSEADLLTTAARFHADPGAVLRAYRKSHPHASPGRLRTALLGDGLFGTGTRALTDAHALHGPTWAYRFGWRSSGLGASHVMELPFVFDRLDLPALHGPRALVGEGPAPQDLADRMHAAWIRFATTGDPGWPRHPDVGQFG
jgi:para-nitrobenzyl esterase